MAKHTRTNIDFASGHELVRNMQILVENFHENPHDQHRLLRGRMWVVEGKRMAVKPVKKTGLPADDDDDDDEGHTVG